MSQMIWLRKTNTWNLERWKTILLIISVGVTIGDKMILIGDFHSLYDKYYWLSTCSCIYKPKDGQNHSILSVYYRPRSGPRPFGGVSLQVQVQLGLFGGKAPPRSRSLRSQFWPFQVLLGPCLVFRKGGPGLIGLAAVWNVQVQVWPSGFFKLWAPLLVIGLG
jgi:hypothetical protein